MRQLPVLGVAALALFSLGACDRVGTSPKAEPSTTATPSATASETLDPSPHSSPDQDFDNEPGTRRLLDIDSKTGAQNAGRVKVKKGVVWVRFTCQGTDSSVAVNFKPLGRLDFTCLKTGKETLNQLNLDSPRELTFEVADDMSETTQWALRVSQR